MIKVQFLYSKLTDIPDFERIKDYERLIKPLDYEFYLERGRYYNLWGVITFLGLPWFYIDTEESYQRIQTKPAALFNKVEWIELPKDWQIHIDPRACDTVELVPSAFAAIDHWFERYIDDDPEVVEIVNWELIKAEDPRLAKLLEDLRRSTWKEDNRSTAAAVRYERLTGELIGRKSHIQKAQEGVRLLESWLRANPNASNVARTAAETTLKDLLDSLKGL